MNSDQQHHDPLDGIKWATRQRLQYIEVMAYYRGLVTRTDVARAFGISDPAATKDLKLYGDLAPDNLIYKQAQFGYVPGPGFQQRLADLSPATVLPMIAHNLSSMSGPYGEERIYAIPAEALPSPVRLPDAETTAQVTRAVAQGKKLAISYRSLSDREEGDEGIRIIEPHSLVHDGLRWHLRAYNLEGFDFRDYVLSRIAQAQVSDLDRDSDPEHDEEWVESITLELAPHPGLNERQRQNLLLDYGVEGGVTEGNGLITIEVRRALLGYLLRRLSVDTSEGHSRNPGAYPLIVANRDEVEVFAEWVFGE